MNNTDKQLNVALIGYGFIGRAHCHAWRNAASFFDLPAKPVLRVLSGHGVERIADGAQRFGWESYEEDWTKVIADPSIDVIDICTPGLSHPEIAVAALNAGKHVLCEKPLANTVPDAAAMAAAASAASAHGVQAMVGFNYRRMPAVVLGRQLISEGRLGVIRQVRAAYRQDFIVDPSVPLAWRLQKDKAGSGALGDIGAHIVDLSQYLLGDMITQVSGTLETFIKERPRQASGVGLGGGIAGVGMGPVTVDDAAWFTARFANGAIGSYEATRFATGRKNALTIEISGSQGALRWNLEDMNVLEFYDNGIAAPHAGFSRIIVTEPEHPYMTAWWPAGHVIGWEHAMTHQVVDFVTAIASGVAPEPSFADGLYVQRILAGVENSFAKQSRWVEVEQPTQEDNISNTDGSNDD